MLITSCLTFISYNWKSLDFSCIFFFSLFMHHFMIMEDINLVQLHFMCCYRGINQDLMVARRSDSHFTNGLK